MRAVFTTVRFEVFRITCDRSQDGAMPRDVYLAFYRECDMPRPVCTVTIWPQFPMWDSDGNLSETKGRWIEWCEVDPQFRREGIATEVLLAIQKFAGPLHGLGVTHEGEGLMEAIGDRLTGTPHVWRDDWLKGLGYDAEQREQIQTECRTASSRFGFDADYGMILEKFEPNTAKREL